MFFSFTGVITTAANIEHVLTKAGRIGIEIPVGVATLNYGSDTEAATAYLVELQSD